MISELTQALPQGSHPLTCAAVWLLQPPESVNSSVWALVCAAALEAMASGCRTLWALHLGSLARMDTDQTLITDFFEREEGPRPLTLLQCACRKAAARFWCLLQDFVWLQQVPEGWEGVPTDHPFIGVVQVPGG